MSDVTRILFQIEEGDGKAAEQICKPARRSAVFALMVSDTGIV